jgi:hypothetical protein
MTAMKKEELERLEKENGLEPDGLSYQHRCSRITAVMRGEEWQPPKPSRQKAAPQQNDGDIKHHKLYPPKRTGEGLVIQDILYVDIVGIIGDFMKCFPDFDPDKYESTDEHGERIRKRCKDCAYLRDDWKCDDNGMSVYDIPDEACSANETRTMTETKGE